MASLLACKPGMAQAVKAGGAVTTARAVPPISVASRRVRLSSGGVSSSGFGAVVPSGVSYRARRTQIAHASDDESLALFENTRIKDEDTRRLTAEFLGTALFQFFAGAAAASVAAPAAGLSLAILVYAFANASGAHLNPAISIMAALSGHITFSRAFAYSVAQVLGAVLGTVIYTYLIPGLVLGNGNFGPGCFNPASGLTNAVVFAWEAIGTFTLGLVVYATTFAKPGFGGAAPLAIGAAVLAISLTTGSYTGAALNPARVLGPHLAYAYDLGLPVLYVGAQVAGGILAAWVGSLLYGGAKNPSD